MKNTMNVTDTVIRYHERTKHHYDRYAASLGYLDWANQPDPFRTYTGVTPIALPFERPDPGARYIDLYERARNPVRSFSLKNISLFLELALGLSAWKSIPGAEWPLRMNPSSGNLHPTEGYLVIPEAEGARAGLYHYHPYLHALEPRAVFSGGFAGDVRAHLGAPGFLFALTSVYWREAWKYGERAFRYAQHDIGHAMASASFSANLLGWRFTRLDRVSTNDLDHVLGFHNADWPESEDEHAEVLGYVAPAPAGDVARGLTNELLCGFSKLSFGGTPNRLSGDHVSWDVIDEVARATRKGRTEGARVSFPARDFSGAGDSALGAAAIIRKRRSAVAFDGETAISRAAFLAMLDRTLPRPNAAPFDFLLGPVRVHLLIFVHRVSGLSSGLYFFVRDERSADRLRSAARPEFLWREAEPGFPLYLLKEGAFTHEAATVSCGQDIAGRSAFSLGMIARFRETIEEAPHLYRDLFWEAGMIGQVLYLEAEAHSVRATGIGCFFDDPVHEIMGLKNNDYQSLYHFTVGGPVEDSRLQTHPAYHHLAEDRR